MQAIVSGSEAAVGWLWHTSWQVAVLVGMVLLVQWILGRRLSPGVRCAMWGLVVARLLMPAAPQSRFSIHNLVHWDSAARLDGTRWVAQSVPRTSVTLVSGSFNAPAASSVRQVSPKAVSPSAWNWKMLVLLAWLVGVIACLVRTIMAHIWLRRRLDRASPIVDARVLSLLAACRNQMKVSADVELAASAAVHGPALWGILRPKLLLPPGLIERLSDQEMRFIFLHELAHLKRRDIAVDWFLAVVQAIHWLNPAAWLALSRFRADRELARDAMVLAASHPGDRAGYGMTILKLVDGLGLSAARAGAVGILNEHDQLKRRITMIAGFRRNIAGNLIAGAVLMTVLGGIALTDRRMAAADDAVARPLPPATMPEKQQAEAGEGEARLNQRLPEMRFEDQTLTSVIDSLRDATGAKIFVFWNVLEAAGVKRTSPINARLRDVSLAKALDAILADAGDGRVKLGYAVDDGVIIITTVDDLKDTQIRIYDVRDLVGGQAGGGDKAPQAKGAADEALTREIVDLIKETVDPDGWKTRGDIRCLSGQLIINTTRENHELIVSLLVALRESRQIQISIETRIIAANPEVLRNLTDDQGRRVKLAPLTMADGAQARPGLQAVLLDNAQVNAVLRQMQANRDSSIVSAPRVTTFNGQRAQVKVGEQAEYVADYAAITKSDGKTEYTPKLEQIDCGISLELQPTLSADRKYVTVSLRAKLCQLTGIESVPYPKSPPDQKLSIQLPRMDIERLDALVSIPDGGTMALTGFRLTHDPKAPAGEGQPCEGLLILVKPQIIIQREIEQQKFPLLESKK